MTYTLLPQAPDLSELGGTQVTSQSVQSPRKKKKEKDALYIASGVHADVLAGVYASLYRCVHGCALGAIIIVVVRVIVWCNGWAVNSDRCS